MKLPEHWTNNLFLNMPRILIAPDKFKGTLTAAEVAQAVARGLARSRPDAVTLLAPVADGGDGTVAAAVAAGFTPVQVTASGPTGKPVRTRYAHRNGLAVVELADVSGLGHLPDGVPAPMTATSRGTGEVLAAALDAGCRRIILGIGGSATTDGGAGLVRALGARLLDADGRELPEGGAALSSIASIELADMKDFRGVSMTVACDVQSPLLGAEGAAAVYGPQKGADSAQVELLDSALGRWADVVAETTGVDHRATPGAGGAGGVGFAALALLGAELQAGIGVMLDLIGLYDILKGSDLVVTGEGALDEQTLLGKAPAGVARVAREAGIPVVAVCGRNTLTPTALRAAGISKAHALTELEPNLERCIQRSTQLLEQVGETLGAEHLGPRPRQP